MDYLVLADRTHREAMQRGSEQLLQAIKWARLGHNPVTRQEPLKLPPDWTNKVAPDYSAKPKYPRSVPCSERVRELMDEGREVSEIAAVLKQSRQKVLIAMKTVKLQRRKDDFEERINQKLWG